MSSSTWTLSLTRWNFSGDNQQTEEQLVGLQVDEPGANICYLIQEQEVCIHDLHPECGHGEVHGPAVYEVDGLLKSRLVDPRQLEREDLLVGLVPSPPKKSLNREEENFL